MAIKLNCLSCGHTIDLGDAYEDYQGEVKCWGCEALLEVALQEGKLKSMRRGGSGVQAPPTRNSAVEGLPPSLPLEAQASPAASELLREASELSRHAAGWVVRQVDPEER